MNLPDGGSFDYYRTRVVKAQAYTSDALFEKQLLLLLPYHLMRYERDLAKIAADGERSSWLVAECADLRARLEVATLAAGKVLLYREFAQLIMRVNDHLLRKQENLREKARGAMGGEILELLDDKIERLEREVREAREAHAQGIAQGMERGMNGLAAKLRENGVDEALLAEATAAVLAESKAS